MCSNLESVSEIRCTDVDMLLCISHIIIFCQFQQKVKIRHIATRFPSPDCPVGYPEYFRQMLLCYPFFGLQLL